MPWVFSPVRDSCGRPVEPVTVACRTDYGGSLAWHPAQDAGRLRLYGQCSLATLGARPRSGKGAVSRASKSCGCRAEPGDYTSCMKVQIRFMVITTIGPEETRPAR